MDGTTFGIYELRSRLGRGGMGEVWRAFDRQREREIALKVMSPELGGDTAFVERFRREARMTARLSSAHIVPIHDFGEIDGRPFMDMRLVPGGDLADALARSGGGMEPHRAADVTAQIADALGAAHEMGMLHRDVKPSNVLIEADARGRDHCYLVDFGIAKLVRDATMTTLTATGMTLGSPAYMAPEIFTSAEEASERSDVYALGCVLYEMLTGRPPFHADEIIHLLYQHVHGPVPLPSAHDPALAPFDAAVTGALAKEPDERTPSVGALVEDLPRAADLPHHRRQDGVVTLDTRGRPEPAPAPAPAPAPDPDPASSPSPPSPAHGGRVRRTRVVAGLAAVCVLVAVAVVAGVTTRGESSAGVAAPPTATAPTIPPFVVPTTTSTPLSTAGPVHVRRAGTTAISHSRVPDLDSLAGNWDLASPYGDGDQEKQDIQIMDFVAGTGTGPVPPPSPFYLSILGSATVARVDGPAQYDTCADVASYEIYMPLVNGASYCVETTEHRYAYVKLRDFDPTQVLATLDVTVWDPQTATNT